jgi:hypothetical protein
MTLLTKESASGTMNHPGPNRGSSLRVAAKTLLAVSPLLLNLAFAQDQTPLSNPMQDLLPQSILQWRVSEPPRSYPGTRIFEYMDGAGEVYRAYDFKDLLVQRYACPNQEEILVEIFDMRSARNAFGVFTYMKGRGPAVPVGQDGEYKSGLLCFWKGKYFVYTMIDKENDEATKAVLKLGKAISDAIHETGERPPFLQLLPQGEYLPNTLRYFFTHEILNSHFYVADGNPLLLDGTTEGLLVRMKHDKSYLLLIGYPSRGQADSGYTSFLKQYMPRTLEQGIVKTANGKWTACMKQNTSIAIVFDAATRKEATRILNIVKRRLP